jgi:hypothetical protein
MSFFKKLYKSVYSPELYQEVIQQPAGKAVKYYFGMLSLLAIVAAVVLTLIAAPKIRSFISEIGVQAMNLLPDGLELTIKNGIVSINQPEPFAIRLPETFIQSQRSQGSAAPFEYAVVVDTRAPFSYERFVSYNTFAWVGKNGLAITDREVRARYIEFGSSTSQVINKPLVTGLTQRAVSVVNKMVWFLAPFFFVIVLAVGLFNLAYCAFLAILVRLIANKVEHLDLSYGQAWSATLYLATLGTLWLFINVCILGLEIPFGFTVITLVLAYVNLKGMAPPPVNQPVLIQDDNQPQAPTDALPPTAGL